MQIHSQLSNAIQGLKWHVWNTGQNLGGCQSVSLYFSCSLKKYVESMDSAAKLLVEEMQDAASSNEKYVDIQPMVQAMTMNVIGQSAYG